MLLRHGHMRPRTARASAAQSAAAPSSEEPTQPRDAEDQALALLQAARPRRVSKNCATIKRYGDRLSIRRRQRHAERVVVEDVERLRHTLAAMDRRLALLDSITLSVRQNAEAAAMGMIHTYFRHMRHGLNPRDVAYDREVTTPFLEAMFTPDLRCQDFSGLVHIFQQWEYVTKFHADFEMDNSLLTPLPVESDSFGNDVLLVKAQGLTHCRISRETLVHFFPHIMQDEQLVQWLIGKSYSFGYAMVFHVNSAGKVFQFESRIDLTSGLLNLLSDPRTTLQMVESSMWTTGGNLRGEVQEQQIPIENGVLT